MIYTVLLTQAVSENVKKCVKQHYYYYLKNYVYS